MYLWSGTAESGSENELSEKMSWNQAQPAASNLWLQGGEAGTRSHFSRGLVSKMTALVPGKKEK